MSIKFKKLHADAKLPTRAHRTDAGMDVYTIEDVVVPPRGDAITGLGIASAFDDDHALLVFNKSGRATKLKLDKGAEVIDSGYRGEIHVHLFNHSDESAVIKKGEKIAQLLLVKIWNGQPEEIDLIDEAPEGWDDQTERGTGGFGSTGLK